jgi:hypothetical protein
MTEPTEMLPTHDSILLSKFRRGGDFGVHEWTKLSKCVCLTGTAEDRARLFQKLGRVNETGIDAVLGLKAVSTGLWHMPDAKGLNEYREWLSASSPKPRFSVNAWGFVATGSRDLAEPPQDKIEAWMEGFFQFRQMDEEAHHGRKLRQERETAVLAYATAAGPSPGGPLRAAMRISENPARIAAIADGVMRTPKGASVTTRSRVLDLERTEGVHLFLGDEVYRARFSGEGALSDPALASDWIRRGVASGVGQPVLDFMVEQQPNACRGLRRSHLVVHDTIGSLLFNAATAEAAKGRGNHPFPAEEIARRSAWFLDQVGPAKKLKETPISEDISKRMPPELADVLLSRWGPAAMGRGVGMSAETEFRRRLKDNPALALWQVREGIVRVETFAERLASGQRFGDIPGAASTGAALLGEALGLPFEEHEAVSLKRAAAVTSSREIGAVLRERGFAPDWSSLPCLFIQGLADTPFFRLTFETDETLSACGVRTSLVPAVVKEIQAHARPAEDDSVSKALMDVLSIQAEEPPGVHPEGARFYQLLERMRIVRECGIALTDRDLLKLSSSVLRSVPGQRDGTPPPWMDLIGAELAEWAGPERAPLFVDSLPHPARVQQIRDANEGWRRRLGMEPPFGLYGRSCYGVRPATFSYALDGLQSENPDLSKDAEVAKNRYALGLATLFGTPDRLHRYLNTHFLSKDEHPNRLNAAAQFELPDRPGWPLSQWGDAALRFGPSMAKFVRFAVKDEAPAPSLAAARSTYCTRMFAGGEREPEVARVCLALELTQHDFDAISAAQAQVKSEVAGKQIPLLDIDGAEFDMPGYRWKKAPPGDPRILVAGHLVDCCQHITGAARAAALHSATSDRGACYFLEKNPEAEGDIPSVVGASWLWLGAKGTLCIDSFETLGGGYTGKLPHLLQSMRDKLKKEHPDIKDLTIGAGGGTPSLILPLLSSGESDVPSDHSGYRDSHAQFVVASADKTVDLKCAQRLREMMTQDPSGLYGRF